MTDKQKLDILKRAIDRALEKISEVIKYNQNDQTEEDLCFANNTLVNAYKRAKL